MDYEKKILRYTRITAWLFGALLVLLCALSLLLAPKAVRVLRHAEETLGSIDTLSETAQAALISANTAAETANQLVAGNADAVSEAMAKFNSVDFQSLNRAIKDLADIVEPLAAVSNFFRQ